MPESSLADRSEKFSDPLGRRVFARTIVRHIIETGGGNIIGITGAEGSGKTELLRLVRLHADEEFFLQNQDHIEDTLGNAIEKFWSEIPTVRTFFVIRINILDLPDGHDPCMAIILGILADLVSRAGSGVSRLSRTGDTYRRLVDHASQVFRRLRGESTDLVLPNNSARNTHLLATLVEGWNARVDTGGLVRTCIHEALVPVPDGQIILMLENLPRLAHSQQKILLRDLSSLLERTDTTILAEVSDDTDD